MVELLAVAVPVGVVLAVRVAAALLGVAEPQAAEVLVEGLIQAAAVLTAAAVPLAPPTWKKLAQLASLSVLQLRFATARASVSTTAQQTGAAAAPLTLKAVAAALVVVLQILAVAARAAVRGAAQVVAMVMATVRARIAKRAFLALANLAFLARAMPSSAP